MCFDHDMKISSYGEACIDIISARFDFRGIRFHRH